MTVEKIQHDGMIVITDIVNGVYLRQRYIEYTLTDAKKAFRQYVKEFKSTGRI